MNEKQRHTQKQMQRQPQKQMQRQPQKGNRKRSVFLRIFLVMFFCTVGVGCWGEYQEYQTIQEQRLAVQEQIAEEEDRQAELEAKREYYESDAYIAEVAREQLGLLKPGETVYVNRSN